VNHFAVTNITSGIPTERLDNTDESRAAKTRPSSSTSKRFEPLDGCFLTIERLLLHPVETSADQQELGAVE
jgi:hypothetical protein